MKHHKNKRTLGRETAQRTALLRSLAQALVVRGRIETTSARAKELRPFIERLVTHARTGTVASRRIVTARLGGDVKSTAKLFKTIAPRYGSRHGGYTRIVKTSPRKGDAAAMAIIEFIE
jgi:large subunit ribosomal protein L17